MITFAKRNLKVFFKDRSAVFFSLLAVFIIIGLYALFLGDVWTENFNEVSNARLLMDNWIMAGILAVTSMTTTMGAFGIMVDDKFKKISKDFYSAPLKRSSITGGYILASFTVGIIMSLVAFVLAEIYILIQGGDLISGMAFLKILGLIVLATFASTAVVGFLVSFFKSQNAFAAASTVIGTLIGFVAGIYLPIGMLPESVQMVIKVFPVSHAAVLFRQVMMEDAIVKGFKGAPVEAVSGFKEMLGVNFTFGDYEVSVWVSILILIGTGILFYILAILNMRRKSK